MHGEAWVNTRHPGGRPAAGARHALRRPRDRQPRRPTRQAREEDPRRASTRPRSTRTSRSTSRMVGDVARRARRSSRRSVAQRDRAQWLARIDELKGDSAVRDIQALPDNGHLYAAHVIHDLWRITEGKALVVTDVGQHQMWEAQYYKHDHPRTLDHLGRPGHDGLRAAGRDRRARSRGRTRRSGSIAGDGGFQMTACRAVAPRAGGHQVNIAIINNGYLGMVRQWQEFFYGGRYVGDAAAEPRLRQARRGPRPARPARDDAASEVEAAVDEARARAAARWSSTSASSRKTASTRWCPRGADLDDMIRRPSAPRAVADRPTATRPERDPRPGGLTR